MNLKDKVDNCLKEGQRGERHKGLRKVEINEEKIQEHIAKAIHNFNAINIFSKAGYSDWSASASFYSLYHLLLALIAKKGFESRNQNCTFAMIEQMIENKEIGLKKEELKEIFDKDVKENFEHSSKILDIRETMQYSTKTFLEKKEFEFLKERTKLLFDELRNEIEAI